MTLTAPFEPADVLKGLEMRRCPISELDATPKPGVYALFLDGESLGGVPVGVEGLVYVGTSINLAQREFDTHFSPRGTGFSTVRRSFGAILKKELGLKARPRGRGLKRQDLLCYVFDPSGEERLTRWMHENVRVAVYPTVEHRAAEDKLVPLAEPLLNLNKWKNPYRTEIMRLRAACVDEAGSHN
jgi:hypothetical protein